MKKQTGFTLIEIGIVLFVVGILIVVFMPSFTQDIKDTGRAKVFYTSAIRTFDAVNALASSCNISRDSVLSSTGTSTLYVGGTFDLHGAYNILSQGRDQVLPAYQYCYDQANIKPIVYPSLPGSSMIIGSASGMGFQSPMITWSFTPNDNLIKEFAKLMGLDPTVYDCVSFATYNNSKYYVRPIGFGGGNVVGSCNIRIQYNELS